jgi:DNA-binding FadR family transcriptional regulator
VDVLGEQEEKARLAPPRPRFGAARVADAIAAVLREQIIDNEIVDDELPTQEHLLEQLNVSRQSLRAALSILEGEGLVTVRRGSTGGAVVHRPNAETAAYLFGLVLQSRRVSIDDLAEALRFVEPVAAKLLAHDASKATLDRLNALTDAAEEAIADARAFTRLAREFHSVVVKECGNETIRLMAGVLETLWLEQIQQWADKVDREGEYPDLAIRQSALDVHRRLLVAIEKGAEEQAYTLAQAHLEASRNHLLSGAENRRVIATSLKQSISHLPLERPVPR